MGTDDGPDDGEDHDAVAAAMRWVGRSRPNAVAAVAVGLAVLTASAAVGHVLHSFDTVWPDKPTPPTPPAPVPEG